MKRLLLALLPWMAMTSITAAQTAPADVVFTHMGTVDEWCVRVEDECFVPLTFLDYVGWDYSQVRGFADLRVEDQKVRVPIRDIDGRPLVPLKMALDKLGGEGAWDGNRFYALSPLNEVRIRDGKFSISSNLPVQPKVMLMENPPRIVVDIQGAKLSRRTNVDLDGTSRIAQFKPDVVRIVLEANADTTLLNRKFKAGRNFEFYAVLPSGITRTPGSSQGNVESPVKDPQRPPEKKVPLQEPIKNPPFDPASNPDMTPVANTGSSPRLQTTAQVTGLYVDAETTRSASLSLKFTGNLGKAPIFKRPEPDKLEITLPGAALAENANMDARGASVESVEARADNGSVIITLSLQRPMGVEFSLAAGGMQIQLLKPEVGNGKLAGKVIVVDPGHGGHDAGAQGGGKSEKDMTLAIAKRVSAQLAAEGATVIMTRKTDVFISLSERPAIANRNKADFFISIHINSNQVSNSATGTITFYHGGEPIGQLLAECIHREIVKRSGLGGMGVWSDKRIYNSGFAVLRGANMPAIMVECGFINTTKDRNQMLTNQFQDGVAAGVVKGIKVFLGDEKKD